MYVLMIENKETTNKNKYFYAIYDKHENLVFVGNSNECREFLDTTMSSFYCLVTRTANGIIKGYKYRVYKIESGEEDE